MGVWRGEDLMRLNPLPRRHHRLRELLDAYVDGELSPGELARFESHLATCTGCRAETEQARSVKRTLSGLPAASVPRSFQITPAMVAETKPAAPRQAAAGRLVLARAAAALSLGAFAIAATVSLLSGSGQDASTAASGGVEMYDAASEKRTSGGDEATGAPRENDLAVDGGGTPVVPLAASPLPGGGVSDAGVDPTPVPDRGGITAQDSSDDAATSSAAEDPLPSAGLAAGPGTEISSPYQAEEDGASPSTLAMYALGVIAVATVGSVAFLEISRRR